MKISIVPINYNNAKVQKVYGVMYGDEITFMVERMSVIEYNY